jgi:hypothetical protein
MDIHLVVVKPFGNFSRGDIVTDATRIAAILRSEYTRWVVRVARQVREGA